MSGWFATASPPFLTWNGNVSDVREETDLPERELRYWALRYGKIPGGVLRASTRWS